MAVWANMLPHCMAFLLLLFFMYRSGAKIVTIDVRAAKNLIQTDHIYIDVRTVKEFAKGRVKNPNFLKEFSFVCNKEDLLVVGCQSGVRSLYATSDLLSDGFKNVKDMGGGYVDWVRNKFPINTSVRSQRRTIISSYSYDYPSFVSKFLHH
ncbi:hypothetical protein P8452_46270 [Trifolium repens]|nr:Rhodanese/Cell cycle control phosphatase superfamily protein [Trifolium repens]WJX61147.1 hypothetical protein P8452_46270 [Trifolium repens]